MNPFKLDRPLILEVVGKVQGRANLAISPDGKVGIADDDTFEVVELLKARVVARAEEIAEVSAEAAIVSGLQRRAAIFSKGKWFGDDIGSVQEPVRDVHSKGEFLGFRLENYLGIPQASGKSIGRLSLNSIDEKVYLDVGYKMKRISSEKFEMDIQVSNPSEKIVIDLSDSDIDDSRKTIWQVCYNSDDFVRVNAKIKTPSEKSVVIELPEGSSVGTYRVMGVE